MLELDFQTMLNNKLRIIIFFISLVILIPTISFAQQDQTIFGGAFNCQSDPCKISDILPLIKALISFLAFTVSLPLAILALAYAGIKMMVYSDTPGEVGKAKDIIYYTIWGLIMIFAAYFITQAIVEGLTGGTPDEQVQQYLQQ